ncbi:hypothetical protein ASG40_13130 [Methylobacterium sp. Leaf399]|uniref:hypothetical protein n=1 Tax=unclassified Methylobacterium TaxID=2615210 RepID=UPI0006FB8980|nr:MULTISPECIES: hypothetical protein [unclassified Methylobacterium]KQT07844.1 hypothetical protein ASG40_13130 [Methylobacterium sp. Leaf399]KQT88959.1 hypothetical protein ASG59_13905 [Methylobacterium sp. Leaf466]
MANIAIMIGTPGGTRLMAASSERSAALMAEALLVTLGRDALPAPLWVQCADTGIVSRLTAYLGDLQADILGVEAE